MLQIKTKGSGINKNSVSPNSIFAGSTLEFIAFYTKYAGAVLHSNSIWVPERKVGTCIRSFLLPNEVIDIVSMHSIFAKMELISFAEDGSGNFICVSVNQRSAGNIIFWDHEFDYQPGDDILKWLVAADCLSFERECIRFGKDDFDLPSTRAAEIWIDPDFKPEFD